MTPEPTASRSVSFSGDVSGCVLSAEQQPSNKRQRLEHVSSNDLAAAESPLPVDVEEEGGGDVDPQAAPSVDEQDARNGDVIKIEDLTRNDSFQTVGAALPERGENAEGGDAPVESEPLEVFDGAAGEDELVDVFLGGLFTKAGARRREARRLQRSVSIDELSDAEPAEVTQHGPAAMPCDKDDPAVQEPVDEHSAWSLSLHA